MYLSSVDFSINFDLSFDPTKWFLIFDCEVFDYHEKKMQESLLWHLSHLG